MNERIVRITVSEGDESITTTTTVENLARMSESLNINGLLVMFSKANEDLDRKFKIKSGV